MGKPFSLIVSGDFINFCSKRFRIRSLPDPEFQIVQKFLHTGHFQCRTKIARKEFSLPNHLPDLLSADFLSLEIRFHHLLIADCHLFFPFLICLICGKLHTVCI